MLTAKLAVVIDTDSTVLVRDQLVEQIGLQVASGSLKSGDRLPSIRALSQRLTIHQSIVHAAYTRLAEIGMLQIRQGSGARVLPRVGLNLDDRSNPASHFKHFLANMTELGHSRNDITKAIRQTIERPPVSKVVVVDANADFHAVILSELQPHFSLPIEACTASELSQHQELLKDSLVITSLYHLTAIQDLPLDPTRFMLCNVEPPDQAADLLKSVPQSAAVLLVSASPTLLRMAERLAAGLRGETINVRAVLNSDANEIKHALQHARAVICDRPSHEIVGKLAGKVPVRVYEVYSERTINAIKERLREWG